ncbi:MAG: ATP/GTP-binding protein [Anaerolineae bacterium]|nr:ATP/GTP-binding protein [Anaerolineae bacterium]MCX8067182.1 ATP/GTP-binding protein [Anaerolineae bacterium]MDW7990593.1 ATP/GTP-binding protein [Anaerolineae bacterium]
MAYKVVITGAFNTGKSTFISTASEIPVVSTDKPITDSLVTIKETTTVALDYGRTTVRGCIFHLFGTPGQERFDFMCDILSQEADAYLILVDSTDRSTLTFARQALRQVSRCRAPYLIVATKQDGLRPMSIEAIANSLKLPSVDQVVACDPRQKESVYAVLERLCSLLE